MWNKEIPIMSGVYYRTLANPSKNIEYDTKDASQVELVHIIFNEITHRITSTVLYSSASDFIPINKYAVVDRHNLEGKYLYKPFTFPSPPSIEYFPRDYMDDYEEIQTLEDIVHQ